MTYDFKNLSYADFEDLTSDLIGRELGIRFESFTKGPDGGVDGRHSKGGKTIVLQAKHYAESPYSGLKSAMKKERPSIDSLSPNRYILATSRGITPANKRALAKVIGPSLKTESDIWGPEELNSLLKKYSDIEKAHIKLWLSSSAVLDRILNAAIHTHKDITKSDITKKLKIYVKNPSFPEAQKILEENHVLIISGPPGVGKTTLAEMLSYSYLSEGWDLTAIRKLEDGFTSINDQDPQIFFFDDFLGTIALDKQALSQKDSDLCRFMTKVRNSPNARFILTTRAHIFEAAKQASEHLDDPRVDISKYILDVETYTRRIRARILYNHLRVSKISVQHISSLIENDLLVKIIDHKNYNPRIIEWMTDITHLGAVTHDAYPKAFIRALNKPHKIWDKAFKNTIPKKCQHLLITMFFSTGHNVEINKLRLAFEQLHTRLCKKYNESLSIKDFEEALRILESGFISIRDQYVDFINPSLQDYLADYLDEPLLLSDCAKASLDASWCNEIWKHGRKIGLDDTQKQKLALAFKEFAPKITKLPISGKVSNNGFTYSQNMDISNTDRIEMLLEWWDVSQDKIFATIALEIASNPLDGLCSWRDGTYAITLLGELYDGDYYPEFAEYEELKSNFEKALVNMLKLGCTAEELLNISDEFELWEYTIDSDFKNKIAEAISTEFRHYNSDTVIKNLYSASELEDYCTSMEKLASKAEIPEITVNGLKQYIDERIIELDEEYEEQQAPEISKEKNEQNDKFDDDDLHCLFQSLLL